jgi:hypothetical protein
MELMNCPCKDCERRTITCHSTCKEYLEYAEYRKRINEKERKEKQFEQSVIERRKKWKTKN